MRGQIEIGYFQKRGGFTERCPIKRRGRAPREMLRMLAHKFAAVIATRQLFVNRKARDADLENGRGDFLLKARGTSARTRADDVYSLV